LKIIGLQVAKIGTVDPERTVLLVLLTKLSKPADQSVKKKIVDQPMGVCLNSSHWGLKLRPQAKKGGYRNI